jgi:hypothetical protein
MGRQTLCETERVYSSSLFKSSTRRATKLTAPRDPSQSHTKPSCVGWSAALDFEILRGPKAQ